MADTLEQLDELKQMARESFPKELPKAPGFGTREIVLVLNETSSFVRLLMLIWALEQARLHRSGTSASLFLQDCDLLLTLAASAKDALAKNEDLLLRELPAEIAQPFHTEVREAAKRLDALIEGVGKVREWAAMPQRVAPDLAELKQRTRRADEGKEWVRLADAVARMREGGSQKQE
jgi:hypothetical protein